MSMRRLKELGTMLAIGDGVIARVAARRHSLLPVEVRPRRLQAGRGVAKRPALVRLLPAAEVAGGLWLALAVRGGISADVLVQKAPAL